MTARYAIILWLIAVAVAFIFRYALARFLITFHSGDSSRGYPIHNYAFWLVLAIAGILMLVKLVRVR
jgi:succinate dehydrogenase/fumarate reductase cytochrome b subunit